MARELTMRKGQDFTFDTLGEYIETAGYPENITFPAWAWTRIVWNGVHPNLWKDDEIGPYFTFGPTKVRPELPSNRQETVAVIEVDSLILMPDKVIAS